jgi:uncharacterized protein YfkK (UPF0435 family)
VQIRPNSFDGSAHEPTQTARWGYGVAAAGIRTDLAALRQWQGFSMDSASISALSALGGALIGGLTSFAASWVSQQTQVKAQQLSHKLTRREDLYKRFIEEASRLYADSLVHETPDVSQLIGLYAMISMMRAISPSTIVQHADKVGRLIVNTYLEPNKSIFELRDMVNSGVMDPLRDFSEACREEFQRLEYL